MFTRKIEYVSYKKLLIFGSKGTGKTSLAKTFHLENFDNEIEPSENSIK
jgi:SpoVK/Ycf46/Vps4 family AAA+-type ATPase